MYFEKFLKFKIILKDLRSRFVLIFFLIYLGYDRKYLRCFFRFFFGGFFDRIKVKGFVWNVIFD